MAKWLGIVAVLGLAAGAGYWVTGPGSAESKTCAKLEALCGAAVLPADACEEDLASVTEHDLDGLVACVEPADSCLEVTGCLTGSVAREFAQGAFRGLVGF